MLILSISKVTCSLNLNKNEAFKRLRNNTFIKWFKATSHYILRMFWTPRSRSVDYLKNNIFSLESNILVCWKDHIISFNLDDGFYSDALKKSLFCTFLKKTFPFLGFSYLYKIKDFSWESLKQYCAFRQAYRLSC